MPESYLHVLPVHRTHTYSGRPRIRRLRHLFVLGLPITFLFFWLIRIAARDKWVRDFGYITRPLWDRSANEDRPQTTIPHYDVSGSIIPGELCTLHGWSNSSSTSSHSSPPKVYDAFLYSIELDLLEIRLHELWDVVDTFVIIEATRSFSGDLRHDMTPLSSLLASPQARLNWAGPKIKYELVDDLSPSPKDPFDNERHLRQRMDLLLSSAGVRPNDIILMSDLDEIPTPHTITLLKQCSNWPSPLHLQMRNYLYSFEFPVQDDGYWRPKAVRWGGPGSSYNHAKGGDIMLANAGWHCSWCFRYIEDIQFKMTVRPNSNLFASKSTHFSVSIKIHDHIRFHILRDTAITIASKVNINLIQRELTNTHVMGVTSSTCTLYALTFPLLFSLLTIGPPHYRRHSHSTTSTLNPVHSKYPNHLPIFLIGSSGIRRSTNSSYPEGVSGNIGQHRLRQKDVLQSGRKCRSDGM